MNLAVVGGSGFIGTHLVDGLLEAGHDVTVFDIMGPRRTDVRHIMLDILDTSRTCIALAGAYDAIYLLAAVANVNDALRNPVETIQVNVSGTSNVLEAVRRSESARVILASTVWVCGMASADLVDERTPLAPQKADHVYTASKAAAEMVCYSYSRLYGVPITILRYGIPYGPGARSGSVVASFVSRALSGNRLTVYGDGSQGRKFVYIDDLIAGNLAALNGNAVGKTYLLEGEEHVSVRQVAEAVANEIGGVDIQYEPSRAGDYVPPETSSKLAELDLGWVPVTPFEAGLHRYVEWYRQQMPAGPASGEIRYAESREAATDSSG